MEVWGWTWARGCLDALFPCQKTLPTLTLKRFSISRVKEVQYWDYLLFVWINRLLALKHESMSRPTKGWATPAPAAAPRSAIPGASGGDSNIIRECVEGVRKSDRWSSRLSYLQGDSLLLCTITPNIRALNMPIKSAAIWTSHTGFWGTWQFYHTYASQALQYLQCDTWTARESTKLCHSDIMGHIWQLLTLFNLKVYVRMDAPINSLTSTVTKA